MKQVGHQPIYWLFIAITFTIFGIGINSGTPIQANQIPPAMQTHGVSRNGHSISEKATVKLINQAPDMDPDRTILTLKPADYKTNEKLFDTAYNVFSFSPRTMFKKHTATIYVADHQLRPLTKAAIQKWNTALKFPVFKMGTSKTQTLSIRFTSTTADNWDGLYNGKTILIAKNHFKDPKYPVAYINHRSQLKCRPASIGPGSSPTNSATPWDWITRLTKRTLCTQQIVKEMSLPSITGVTQLNVHLLVWTAPKWRAYLSAIYTVLNSQNNWGTGSR